MDEVEAFSVDNEQNVDNSKQVMGVPKSIEAGKPVKGLRELHQAPAKPVCCEGEGHHHAYHHNDSSDSLRTSH